MSTWDSRECTDCSKCKDGWCGPLTCCCGAVFGFLEHIWTTYNKILVSFVTLSFIISCLAMLGLFSMQYNDTLTNPTEYEYTTCIIKSIYGYKDDDDKDQNEITFIYSLDNEDWTKEGLYVVQPDDWDELRNPNDPDIGYVEGDIGTCVYAINTDDDDDTFTVQNFAIPQDTSAMWLIVDGKITLISVIIFFVFSCVFLSAVFGAWVSGGLTKGGGSSENCGEVECSTVSGAIFVSFVLACMIVGWPLFIMSLVILSGLGKLDDAIVVDDVYFDMGSCIIREVTDEAFYSSVQDTVGFTLVKYNVFTNDGNVIGVAVYEGADNSAQYFRADDVTTCLRNMDTGQVMLEDAPYVGWLGVPMKKGTCILILVLGILLICAPCTLAILACLSG